MRTITVVLGILLLCVLAPVSSKAKTGHTRCEDRCRAYHCPDSVRRELYCHYQCRKMCASEERSRNRFPSDKDHAARVNRAATCENRDFKDGGLLNFTFCETTGQ
jgi:hypothetical protein